MVLSGGGALTVATTVCLALPLSAAIDNGLGVTPPKGWRSWNFYLSTVNQTVMKAQMDAAVDKSRSVNGVPTSLAELGYDLIAMDDGWQKCNAGPAGVGFHDTKGRPIVDTAKFPSMKSMTAKASSLGITPGFYINNCMCKETRPACASVSGKDTCFEGDVEATLELGFRSVKVCSLPRSCALSLHLRCTLYA